jgi:aspartyl protease family protein
VRICVLGYVMALSRSGRRLMLEAVGSIAVLVAGAYVLTHGSETRALIAKIAGMRATQNSAAAKPADIIERSNPTSSGRRKVELAAGGNNHFFAEAELNGRPVQVMVDTGASMVALTYDDARRAGIYPRDSDFTGRSNTANGVARFAPIEIDRVSIGGIEVRNVRAAVMEDGKLDTSLLGMTYLSKIGSVSLKSGRLVLEE